MSMEKSPKSSPEVVGEIGFGWGFVGRKVDKSRVPSMKKEGKF